MKLKFLISYQTQFGENLYVTGSAKSLGAGSLDAAIKMSLTSGEQWELEVEVEKGEEVSYRYLLKDDYTGYFLHEFGKNRVLNIADQEKSCLIFDFWRPERLPDNSLYKAPFINSFFSRTQSSNQPSTAESSHFQLRLSAPRVGADYQIGILGNTDELGNWDENRVVLLDDSDFPVWKVNLKNKTAQSTFEYKYVIYSKKEQRLVEWESGENRVYSPSSLEDSTNCVIRNDEHFRYPQGNWKAAGVAIPVFSLRSDNGAGVGEFTDIKLLVDWASLTGLKIIQVLPVNDTIASHTWKDSYPYAAISVHALHPIYANMEAIGELEDAELREDISQESRRLNALPELDYEAVMKLKSKFYRAIFKEQKVGFLKSQEYLTFYENNKIWLPEYAAFSYLRDKYGTPDFTKWGNHSQLTDQQLADLVSPTSDHYEDVAIHYFIQFHLDKQLKEATQYARSNKVVLKGDIPIGIYRNSVDAWRVPELFNMDTQAGAPPDDFAVAGQNWGFPTYDWDEMSKDDFEWWKDRLIKMSDYFDVFRIDHILGFFRIWEIPWEHVEGLLGKFNPALPFTVSELSTWQIELDEDRFCKPYIRTHMIHEIFGSHAQIVFDEFLQENSGGCFEFVPALNTQRKVKDHFDRLIVENPENEALNNWMRSSLYRLHAEVIFLKGTDNQEFVPRINFDETYSFKELDDSTKQRLSDLHTEYFYKRHNEFWRERAMQKLPMLQEATDMLICGEDLGMVPSSVPGVMDELQILSLAIQRMPNDDREFWHPADTPYMSVTSTGSHDMSTLREWWQEDEQRTQRFFNTILGQHGHAPQDCEPWVVRDIIEQHLHSPSMLAILPIQDLIAMDDGLRFENPELERINVPANPQHYWKYRFHINVEDLIEEKAFNGFLRALIDQSGRNSDY